LLSLSLLLVLPSLHSLSSLPLPLLLLLLLLLCCVLCLCLHQLMVLLGYKQPWCVNLFCAPAAPGASRSSLAATKNVFRPIPRQPSRI
jgi:hypothetical protein